MICFSSTNAKEKASLNTLLSRIFHMIVWFMDVFCLYGRIHQSIYKTDRAHILFYMGTKMQDFVISKNDIQ